MNLFNQNLHNKLYNLSNNLFKLLRKLNKFLHFRLLNKILNGDHLKQQRLQFKLQLHNFLWIYLDSLSNNHLNSNNNNSNYYLEPPKHILNLNLHNNNNNKLLTSTKRSKVLLLLNNCHTSNQPLKYHISCHTNNNSSITNNHFNNLRHIINNIQPHKHNHINLHNNLSITHQNNNQNRNKKMMILVLEILYQLNLKVMWAVHLICLECLI